MYVVVVEVEYKKEERKEENNRNVMVAIRKS